MKKLISSIIIFSAFIIACNNAPAPTSNAAADSNSSASSSGGDKGTITCMLDGQQKKYNVRQSFFEIPLDMGHMDKKEGLEISDGDGKHEGFQFEFKNSGTTKISGNARGDMNCIINYYNAQGITYTGEDVTVQVISYDKSHLTGTFSGKLVNVMHESNLPNNPANNYPLYIQITDGKFDLQR